MSNNTDQYIFIGPEEIIHFGIRDYNFTIGKLYSTYFLDLTGQKYVKDDKGKYLLNVENNKSFITLSKYREQKINTVLE